MIIYRRSSFLSLGLLVALALALAGCACTDCDLPPQQIWPYIQMAPMAPPDPLDEDVIIPDEPSSFLWRPGFWIYNGQSFDWNHGVMLQRPSPTAIWSQDHWIEHTYGWAFMPGYWQ